MIDYIIRTNHHYILIVNQERNARVLLNEENYAGITEDNGVYYIHSKKPILINGKSPISTFEISIENGDDIIGFHSTDEAIQYCDKHSIEIIDECKEETAHLDSLKSYLDEVSKIPLLTKEEETELGLRILKNDQSAINELVIHNLRLVIKKANRCKHKEKVEILDIIQYGNEGLIEAAKRFDVTKGFRFATYAMWWIYESIDNSIHKDIYTSRISSTKSAYLKVKQYRKAYVDMESKLCREPILEEIAKEMRITVESLKEIISLSTSIDLESLNSQINYGDEEMELLLTIPSTEASIEELIERKDLKSRIIYYLDKMNLTPNQYYVLILRMGLYNEKLYTLDLISKKLNLTRERIRQLEKNAVKKIIFSPYVYPFAKEMLDQYKKGLLYIEQIKPKFIENDKIFNYFRYIDKETIISIIQTLDEETQEIIYKKLGPFLDKPNVVLTDVEECDLFYKGIYDMQKRIEQVNLQKEKKKIRKF